MSCSPTGSPSDSPHGTDMPGRPAMLTGSVQASDRYIATGILEPRAELEGDRRAGRRDERVDLLEGLVEVALDQRADLLRLQVVGVVVAGRERVRAEHDAALDLGAEAAAARRQVVRRCTSPPRADDGRSGCRRSAPGWPTPRPAR